LKEANTMRGSRLVLGLLAASVLLAAACGGGGPAAKAIQTPAKEMNFTAADLGPQWQIGQDMALDEMTAFDDVDHIQDANMRMLSATELTGLVTSFVFSTKTVKQAQTEMRGEAVESAAKDMEEQVPGLTMEPLETPEIGDEASMSGGTLPDLGVNVYVLTFRKANVVVMFSMIASSDVATEEFAIERARKLEAKIR
jgi:hypothetical protein